MEFLFCISVIWCVRMDLCLSCRDIHELHQKFASCRCAFTGRGSQFFWRRRISGHHRCCKTMVHRVSNKKNGRQSKLVEGKCRVSVFLGSRIYLVFLFFFLISLLETLLRKKPTSLSKYSPMSSLKFHDASVKTVKPLLSLLLMFMA